MNKTTHMQRFALVFAAVGCMAVPVQSAFAQAAPQQLQLASNAPVSTAVYSSSDSAVDAPAPAQADPSQQYGSTAPGYAAPVESHSYWHTHGFDLAGLATGRLQQNIDSQGPTQVGQSFDAGFLANIREHPVSWAGIELDYGYQKYTEHFRLLPNSPALNRPLEQHEATAGYVFHIKTPWVQPFVVLGGGGIYFRSTRIQPPAGNGLNEPIGDQWRGTYMANVGFDFTSKRAKNFGLRIEEHSLFYKAPDFYMASLRSNAWIHQAMPAAGFFYRF